jgi:hypothetical protein
VQIPLSTKGTGSKAIALTLSKLFNPSYLPILSKLAKIALTTSSFLHNSSKDPYISFSLANFITHSLSGTIIATR